MPYALWINLNILIRVERVIHLRVIRNVAFYLGARAHGEGVDVHRNEDILVQDVFLLFFNQLGTMLQVRTGVLLCHRAVDMVITNHRRILSTEGEGPEISGRIGGPVDMENAIYVPGKPSRCSLSILRKTGR